MNTESLRRRIDQIRALPDPAEENSSESSRRGSQIVYGVMGVLEAAYGPNGGPTVAMKQQLQKATEESRGTPYGYTWHHLALAAKSALVNLKDEIDIGFTGSLRQQIAGEVLTDFIRLARTALDEGSSEAKNVAAVLAAAAFEDVIRRMGAQFAGVEADDELKDVIGALKSKGILQSPQLGIALSYLSFRNHALHAKWDKIQREAVHSVLGFVEQLLLKHFA